MSYENPYMREIEANCLVSLAQGCKRIVEIGVQEGRTAKYLLERLPLCEYYTGIDVEAGYRFTVPNQQTERPEKPGWRVTDPRFSLIVTPNGTYDLTPQDIGAVDMVFIDGDHSYEAVKWDTKLALSCLKTGGMLVWHDYLNPGTTGVSKAIDEVMGGNITHIAGTWLCFHRVGTH